MDHQEVKAHNLKDKGVCSLECSEKLLYSGGNADGSFFVWKL